MATVTSPPTIRTQDFPVKEQEWIGRLLTPLNSFMTSVVSVINGNLEFGVNQVGITTELEITAGNASFPRTIAYGLSRNAQELRVAQALKNGSPVILAIAWRQEGTSIVLTSAVEISSAGANALTIGARYNIRVRVQP